jgi:hypothetical protein
MASTAFRSVTPLVPRINGADYIAFPLDGNVSGAEGNDCQYAMTVIAEGEPGTVTSNPSLVNVDSGETEVYQVPCDETYEFLASGTAEFYKDDVLVATGVTADIAIDADSEIKIVFLYNPE